MSRLLDAIEKQRGNLLAIKESAERGKKDLRKVCRFELAIGKDCSVVFKRRIKRLREFYFK